MSLNLFSVPISASFRSNRIVNSQYAVHIRYAGARWHRYKSALRIIAELCAHMVHFQIDDRYPRRPEAMAPENKCIISEVIWIFV